MICEITEIRFHQYENRFCVNYIQLNYNTNEFEEMEECFDTEEELDEFVSYLTNVDLELEEEI